MIIFQTAGVALLSTMIGTLVLASKQGRFGDAESGSVEPLLDPQGNAGTSAGTPDAAGEPDPHAGHGGGT
jgi:hypothetical protein